MEPTEGCVIERQVVGVGLADVELGVVGARPPYDRSRDIDTDGLDFPVAGGGDVAGATGDVEQPHAGGDTGSREERFDESTGQCADTPVVVLGGPLPPVVALEPPERITAEIDQI
jgi:hypothetical protein